VQSDEPSVRHSWERMFDESPTKRNETMWTMPSVKGLGELRLAPKGAGPARQLLPSVSRCVQTRALCGPPHALRRERLTTKTRADCRAHGRPRCVLARATMHRLRRDRPARPRVRPSWAQELQHRQGPSELHLAVRARRDCKVRRGLCKLSSTSNGPAGPIRTRGGSSTVEPRPSKAMIRVQFPFAASASAVAQLRSCMGQSNSAPLARRLPAAGRCYVRPSRARPRLPNVAPLPARPPARPPAPPAATARTSCRERRRA
jgi:hypothetical protein